MMSSLFSGVNAFPGAGILTEVPPGPWKRSRFQFLTAFRPHGIILVSGADMNPYRITLAAVLTGAVGAAALAQTTQESVPARKTESSALAQEQFVLPSTALAKKDSVRAEAYYNYTMGHIYEQQYEATSRAEYATSAIEAYKRAYALDPKSPVIGERLAEMYWKAQRIKEAVAEAQQILKRNPDDLQSRRLLGRIYLRSLGDLSSGSGQSETVGRAIEQYREINRLDPSDTESALWLARLYRLKNEHDKAEQVLRGILKTDPENDPAVEQLSQLLMDQGKSPEAVTLLEGTTAHSPSPVLLDLLGDAYTQAHELAKAEEAYRKAVELDPSELSHQRGLGQTTAVPSRRRSLAILYQQLGQLYRDMQNYQASIYTFEELGHLGEEEDRRARMMIMETYRAAKDLPKALQAGKEALAKYPADPAIRTSHALLLGENGQTDDAVKILRAQLHGDAGDRETYLNIAQVYERGRRYKESEEAAHAAEVLPGQARENEMVWFLLGAVYERQKFFDKAEEQFKKVLAVNPKIWSNRRSRKTLSTGRTSTVSAGFISKRTSLTLRRARSGRPWSAKDTTRPFIRISAICTPRQAAAI